MNCNSGNSFHKNQLAGNITAAAATPKAISVHQISRSLRLCLATKTAATPLTSIMPSAIADIFQLNSTNSGSFVLLNRKFCAGVKSGDITCSICTQRCSQAAGTI